MSISQRLIQYHRHKPLGIRLLAAILLCSSLMTLLATGTQLYLDYRYERSAIDERIRQIEASSLASLSNSLWEISPEQIQVQLNGLLQLPDVHYLEITTPFGELFAAGTEPGQGKTLSRHYQLEHRSREGRLFQLGTLKLVISLEGIYQRLEERVLVILTTQGIKTFLVSIFILFIFHRLITQHLGTMADYARNLTLERLDTPLTLARRRPQRQDELGHVVQSINLMRESLLDDIAQREKTEQALATLNAELEQRVEHRTAQLRATNAELQNTLDELRTTQQQLVEAEKMAALGGLVAGVAHEINTPIGIGFTAASWLQDQAQQSLQRAQQAPAHFSQTEKALAESALESSQLISTNLERAAQLVSAFKQVSVDQSSEQRRHFELCEYLDEILTSLQPRLKQANPKISIHCPAGLMLDSYPGAYYQIFTNLIINSLIHGFDNQPGGEIEIRISENNGRLQIDYKDNGLGLPDGWQQKVFEPFMTTRRSEGCTGLGMHITYNLVSQLLRGRIQALPAQRGVHFRVEMATR
ncbi:MAG: ATP-binding protein [Marinobacterium sp.]|nr:ATP-binding protein [Marinobacterium sp.]